MLEFGHLFFLLVIHVGFDVILIRSPRFRKELTDLRERKCIKN